MIRQVAYLTYDLTIRTTYTAGTAEALPEDSDICQKHHRVVSCQIPYGASRAVRQS